MTTTPHDTTAPPTTLDVVRLPGLTDYARAWALQRAVHAEVAAGLRDDTMLLLEHPPTITMGRRGGWANLVTPPERLVELGFELFQIDRGGDITYHGPGQLVGYPIVNLQRAGIELGDFIRNMERAHIATLAGYGLDAGQDPGFTGVWCGLNKITAIGVRVSKWTTLHGFAINLTTDLTHFEHIVACGLHGRGVTSLERQTDPGPDRDAFVTAATHRLATELAARFGRSVVERNAHTLPAVHNDDIAAIRRETRFEPTGTPATAAASGS